MTENGERPPEHPEPRRLRDRLPDTSRQRLYRLAEDYDECVIRVWTTWLIAGMEDEHRTALRQLEAARRRMDRAGRGPATPR